VDFHPIRPVINLRVREVYATDADANSANGWLDKGERLSAKVHAKSLRKTAAHVHFFCSALKSFVIFCLDRIGKRYKYEKFDE